MYHCSVIYTTVDCAMATWVETRDFDEGCISTLVSPKAMKWQQMNQGYCQGLYALLSPTCKLLPNWPCFCSLTAHSPGIACQYLNRPLVWPWPNSCYLQLIRAQTSIFLVSEWFPTKSSLEDLGLCSTEYFQLNVGSGQITVHPMVSQ